MAKRSEDLNGVAALYRARQLAEQCVAPSDDAFRDKYPNLFSLLTNAQVTENKVVDGAFLRVSNSAGDWLLALGVPALGAFAEVMSSTFDAGLVKLETALATGNIGWRFNLKRSAKVRSLRGPEKSG